MSEWSQSPQPAARRISVQMYTEDTLERLVTILGQACEWLSANLAAWFAAMVKRDILGSALRGALAGILELGQQSKTPGQSRASAEQIKVVAGAGFEPATFRL